MLQYQNHKLKWRKPNFNRIGLAAEQSIKKHTFKRLWKTKEYLVDNYVFIVMLNSSNKLNHIQLNDIKQEIRGLIYE